MAAEVLALEDLDVGQRGRARHRVPGVGVAVGELGASGLRLRDHVVDLVGQQRGRQGRVARGEALGGVDDVGLDAEHVLAGEEVAQPAEGGDHLVGDVEDPELAAGLAHGGQVSGRRDQHPARAHDRLREERGHVLRADLVDLGPELRDQMVCVLLRRHLIGAAVQVGARHSGDERLADDVEADVVVSHPGERHGQVAGAVVAVDPGDDGLLVRLAEAVEVEVDDPHRAVVGVGARQPEEGVVEAPRRQ